MISRQVQGGSPVGTDQAPGDVASADPEAEGDEAIVEGAISQARPLIEGRVALLPLVEESAHGGQSPGGEDGLGRDLLSVDPAAAAARSE